MVEYIEREAVEKIVSRYGCTNGSALGRHSGIADCIANEIAKLPTADVAPVRRGKWKIVNNAYGEYECSVCGARDSDCSSYYGAHIVLDQNYCPHCGAYLGLEDEP